MENVFNRFVEIFGERFKKVSILDIGEDSVRFDFYVAAQEELGLDPWDMHLEHPIHSDAFIPRLDAKSKRKEKPKLDLWVKSHENCIAVEFAMFKRNSVDGSRINDTENAFKHLNDLMRLTLHSHFAACESYFVCVADAMMLNRQLEHKRLDKFPCLQYRFDAAELAEYTDGYKSGGKKIDPRFSTKFKELGITVSAELVRNQQLSSSVNNLETRVLIWKVNTDSPMACNTKAVVIDTKIGLAV